MPHKYPSTAAHATAEPDLSCSARASPCGVPSTRLFTISQLSDALTLAGAEVLHALDQRRLVPHARHPRARLSLSGAVHYPAAGPLQGLPFQAGIGRSAARHGAIGTWTVISMALDPS